MIKPGNVPKEAIAELLAFLNSCDCDDCVSVALAAALNAWPGGGWQQITGPNDTLSSSLILPLPTQENGDEA